MLKRIKKSKEFKIFIEPIIEANPVSVAVLGICSALAVTTQVIPSIVMVLAMTFVLTFSNITVSILRNVIPKNIRIIVELVIIASLVIIADQVLKVFMYDFLVNKFKSFSKFILNPVKAFISTGSVFPLFANDSMFLFNALY